MPLIKYQINEGKINEIMTDTNITAASFINLINGKSSEKVTKCYFRGKILDNNDLIRNHITKPDHVLILFTGSTDFQDIMDLDQGSSENTKKEVEKSASSSLSVRKTNSQRRQIFRYTFTIYTTVTPDSMLQGNKIEFPLNTSYSNVHSEVKKLISSFPEIRSIFDFDIHMFLPGGVHFKSGTLANYYESLNNISVDNIYVIVIKKPKNKYSILEKVEEPCSCSNPERKEILSPFCESSSSGLTQISSFLGYMFHGGLKSEQILIVLAKITRFSPLIVNLFRLIERLPLNALNILAITAPLFTLFRSMLPEKIKNENVFEYTLNFLSIFDVTPVSEYLTIFEIDIEKESEEEEMNDFINYCEKTKQQQNVIVWTVDTINKDFPVMTMKPDFSFIHSDFSVCWHQKPEKRPTFKEVAEKLKSDDFLIFENIDREKYQEYIDYIDENNNAFTKSQYVKPKSNHNKKIENPEDIDEILMHSEEIKIINIKEYSIRNLLGKGRYNQVFMIKQIKKDLIFAARISIQPITSEISQSLFSEVMIMKSLNHPSILKFFGYSPIDFEGEHKPTIIIEYSSNGTLQDIIDNKSSFKLDDTKKLIIIYGIVSGMAYLHERSFLHNDLKPSNILIDDDLHPKIADFGLAHKIENTDNKKVVNNNRVIGTPSYIAPEVWNVQSYSKANDVYSFGILLYEFIYMKKAFIGLNPAQIVYALSKKERPPIPETVSSIFEPLITRCWDNDPKKRPTFKEILTELQSNKYSTNKVNIKEFNEFCKFLQSYK